MAGSGLSCLFSLYWDWSPVGPCNILDIISKLKHTHLQICVTSIVIGQTLMKEKADDGETGTTTECSVPHQGSLA